jgi:acyl transferase domain-containing protein/ubiquinone/menaquinone biosynthesis C-methylase UbiE/acyl carrier protein
MTNDLQRSSAAGPASGSYLGHPEPIAIIGIGCRFPGGADDPAKFWRLLTDGVDAIREVPEDRWRVRAFYDPDPAKPGKTYTRWGGFINGIDQFDAQFFGMSSREATRADPQQRVLMEVAYEAIEDAGIALETFAGTNTGVFVGIATLDYGGIQASTAERRAINAYTNLGLALCIAANRLSYAFDLHGPSLAADTACSSSLVTTHLACQSIWAGECDMALAGGVNLIIRPEGTIGFSKASMLAPDGRCKSFDARADGYVRSEGAGVVVLKPLSRALADADPIYAVVRGTVVNQDGRTTGISLPNGAAQEAMLRDAYRQAGVPPEQVQYVEAHGTGTPVGDPIELKAIGNVLGRHRRVDETCVVGSVKTNIGHLEAGSGIAGLIKAALCLQHGQIPPNLHFDTANPDIPFEVLRLRVPRTVEPWPDTRGAPRFAGVNSFGFGGTNAHVVLEAAPEGAGAAPHHTGRPEDRALLVPLSARSPEALEARARSYLTWLTDQAPRDDVSLHDIGYTTGVRRGHHDHRLTVVARSKSELAEHLAAFLAGETRPRMASGRHVAGRFPKVAFVFSGMGPQWWAMARQLLQDEPAFGQVVEQCDSLLRRHADWSLREELTADEFRSRIQETHIAQPAIFALQVGLATLWKSWGVEPATIVGHSVGEVAAAHVAGVLDLEDAVRLVFHRSRLQQRVAGRGAMLAVALPVDEAEQLLAGHEDLVSVAAVNSPTDVTLSGDADVLRDIASSLERKSVFCRFLQVEVPYHSPAMDPLQHELLDSLQGIRPRPASVAMVSAVTGQTVDGPELDPAYWWQNMRSPVRFAAAMDALLSSDHDVFLEISAHPVLAGPITKCLAQAKQAGSVLPTLRRDEPERPLLLGSLGKLYTSGYPVDWRRQYPEPGRVVRLPSYPWQRESYWQESDRAQRERLGVRVHPLLGNQVDAACPVWSTELDDQALPYLGDHRVQDTVVLPAAGYVEMALAAAQESFGQDPYVVEDIALQRAMFVPGGEPLPVQLVLSPSQTSFDVYSRAGGADQGWVRHAAGKFRRSDDGRTGGRVELDQVRTRCAREIAKQDVYRFFDTVGLQYGPCFQTVERLWVGENEALGQIEVSPSLAGDVQDYLVHPTILDAAFQVLVGAIASSGASARAAGRVYLPVQIGRIRLHQRPGGRAFGHARLVEHGASHVTGDVQLLDAAGTVLAEVQGLVCRSIKRRSETWDNYLYEYQWTLKPRAGHSEVRRAPSYIPAPGEIVERLRPEARRLADHLDRRRYYDDLEPQERVLARAYILRALDRLGWLPGLHQRFSTDSLAEQLGVAGQHRRLLARLLGMLAEDGVLERAGNGWQLRQAFERDDPGEVWRALWSHFPAYQAELTLVRQCGERLAEVLRGDIDSLQLIFPQGSVTTAEHLYQDAPTYRIYNLLAQKAVASALERLPDGRTVRILEIGGGTGGMTSYVLRKLPADRTSYVFSDVTQLLLAHAEQKFHEYPFLQYELLDIEADPVTQGFPPHSFDMILASDVLHATRDLHHTLTNVRALLAYEGLLLLLEGTRAPRSVTLMFGLLRGWWLFEDVRLRGADPWIPQTVWQQTLHDVGFTDVAWVTDTEPDERAVHSVLLARGPVVEDAAQDGRAADPVAEGGRWLVFADRLGVGEEVADRLTRDGATPVVVSPGASYRRIKADRFEIRPAVIEDVEKVVHETLSGPEPCRGVVHLWSLDAPPPQELTAAALESAQRSGCVSVLQLAQVLAESGGDEVPRLTLVTRGAQVPGGRGHGVSVAQSPVWGLGRVIGNEQPQLRGRMIDLSPTPTGDEIAALLEELRADDGEDEVALRGEARYVHRLRRVSLATMDGVRQEEVPAEARKPFRVVITEPGILDRLTLTETARRDPGPGEAQIEVHAVGLNFKDVMIAMGLLPDEALEGGYTGKALGMECAGTVVAVGEAMEGFKVGDAVMTSAPGALRTHVTIDERFLVRIPEGMGFEEAATIPITFLTAYYSLHHLGHMQAGDRVLIHAAAGGVGLAAIQLAQRADAEVFATAGTPDKRDLLRALGVKHVMDSRSLAFADEVMDLTGGEGVDIVLNSLAGEAIPKSLAVLRAYGRFIEIGKRDIYEDSKLGLRPFQNNLSLFAVDLDRLCAQRPALIRSLLHDIMRGFEDGSLHPLPHRVFSVSDVVSAFRYIAQAKHIGKVVVSMHDDVLPTPERQETLVLRENATYMISGGLGGFGLATAEWLVEHGARHLVLLGRRGVSSPAAETAVAAMRDAGAAVVVAAADVADEAQVAEVLAGVRQSMPPLRGVVHGAMVLDDALLLQLDEQRMRTVMAPKMTGAWNLHTQTRADELDFFVMLSSFTSMIGNPGQGNYVAANAFLDALAYHRRLQGLPALTVNWGAVSGVGFVAQNPEIGQKLEHVGVKSLPAPQLLRILGALLRYEAVQVGVGHIDWPQLAKVHLFHVSPRLAHLTEATSGDDGEAESAALVDILLALPSEERQQLLSTHIRDQLARLLGMSPAKLHIDEPLLNLGVDSLMAVEIGNQVQAMVGVDVPAMKFMEGLSISGLSAYVLEQLSEQPAAAAAAPVSAEPSQQILEQVERMSDEEVDVLLQEMVVGDVSRSGDHEPTSS